MSLLGNRPSITFCSRVHDWIGKHHNSRRTTTQPQAKQRFVIRSDKLKVDLLNKGSTLVTLYFVIFSLVFYNNNNCCFSLALQSAHETSACSVFLILMCTSNLHFVYIFFFVQLLEHFLSFSRRQSMFNDSSHVRSFGRLHRIHL